MVHTEINPFMLLLEIVVWISNTFDYNFGMYLIPELLVVFLLTFIFKYVYFPNCICSKDSQVTGSVLIKDCFKICIFSQLIVGK